MENKTNNKVFVFFPEVQPTFGEAKGSANRMENKTNNEVFVFFPEVKPTFGEAKVCKPNGKQNK